MTTTNRPPLTPAERADLRQRAEQDERNGKRWLKASPRQVLALLDEREHDLWLATRRRESDAEDCPS